MRESGPVGDGEPAPHLAHGRLVDDAVDVGPGWAVLRAERPRVTPEHEVVAVVTVGPGPAVAVKPAIPRQRDRDDRFPPPFSVPIWRRVHFGI